MTTMRRSVEQTITRLALRQLRERASVAGTAAARSDAPQALALLLDYEVSSAIDSACQTALARHIGCIVVPSSAVDAAVSLLDGAQVRVGTYVTQPEDIQAALTAGAAEIELDAAALVTAAGALDAALKEFVNLCHTAGALLKLDLSRLAISQETLCRLSASADAANVDLIGVPAESLALVRSSTSRYTGFKVAQVHSLAQARDLLHAGAIRLGTASAPQLIDAAQTSGP